MGIGFHLHGVHVTMLGDHFAVSGNRFLVVFGIWSVHSVRFRT
jgi:hypothetical protein